MARPGGLAVTFEFATAGRIVFGEGASRDLAASVRSTGSRALLVTGRTSGRHAELIGSIGAVTDTCEVWATSGEPSIDDVRAGASRARAMSADVVVAIGGGSAMDSAKAIAAMATNPGDVLDYLEVVGRGAPLGVSPLPVIAVPTTAGTGSEVTRNAVLGVPEAGVKVSLRSPLMLPRLAVIDPRLTIDVPRDVTASTGLDALAQVIEPYVSSKATPLTDSICLAGLRAASAGLEAAVLNGADASARTSMSFASLCGGLALANSGLGLAHGLAAPLGGSLGAAHGALVAALLAPVMTANIRALRARAPEHPALARYRHIAGIVTGDSAASAEDGAAWVRALVGRLGLDGLGALGLTRDAVADVVHRATHASSTRGNPLVLTSNEIAAIVADGYGN